MSGFFETSGFVGTEEGTFPLDDIASFCSVEPVDRGSYVVVRRKSDRPALKIWPHEFEDIKARPLQLIPAEPGTHLISVYIADDQPFADKVPLLAWALCLDGQVRPVLPSGVRRGHNWKSTLDWYPDYVEMPDGSIYEWGFEAEPDRHQSVDEVLAVEQRRAKRYADERAKKVDAAEARA